MRQFTTEQQTAKLIELGFEKPKSVISISWDVPEDDGIMINANSIEFHYRYSIGELIEMLPKEMDCELGDLGLSVEYNIYETPNEWIVYYDGRHQTKSIELVDALYDMILKLKEEGVI